MKKPFLKADGSGAQVLFGTGQVVFRLLDLFLRFGHLLLQLCDLQGDHVFGILALRLVQCGFVLRFFHFEKGFAAVENRHVYDDSDVEETAPFLVEAVAHVAVGHHGL